MAGELVSVSTFRVASAIWDGRSRTTKPLLNISSRPLSWARSTFIPGWLGNLHLGLAELALDRNRFEDAKISLEQAEAHYKNTHPRHWWGEIQSTLVRCRLMRAAGNQDWPELARLGHREAMAAGYSRDAAFASALLGGKFHPRNVLMFL